MNITNDGELPRQRGTPVLRSDETLREIIVSGGQSCLDGDESLEETARLIQSKAGLYIAEQYR